MRRLIAITAMPHTEQMAMTVRGCEWMMNIKPVMVAGSRRILVISPGT